MLAKPIGLIKHRRYGFKSSGAFLANPRIKESIAKSLFFLHRVTKNRVVQVVNSQNRVVQMHH